MLNTFKLTYTKTVVVSVLMLIGYIQLIVAKNSSLIYYFHLFLSKVTDYEADGFAVSFLKQKEKGFYINPETEEISSVLTEELVVLEAPKAVSKSRTFGFQFPEDIHQIVTNHFSSLV